jgi:Ser/Thr protein kinase RdoA (MazF antagonist)
MLRPLAKLVSRAALHHRYEPGTTWATAWRLALAAPVERMAQNRLARKAMKRYDLQGARSSFISASGNLVFRVDTEGRSFALRISAPGRRTVEQVHAELAFAADLQQRTGIRTAEALPGRDGDTVQVLDDGDGVARLAVLFAWMDGHSFGGQPTLHGMEQLGRLQARMHAFALASMPPYASKRPLLVADEALRWTRPPERAASLLAAGDSALVAAMCAHLQRVVPDLFDQCPKALVHFDLRGSNLLLNGEEIGVIDLDDCQVAPLLLDVATTLAYTSTKPDAEALRIAFLKGHATVHVPGDTAWAFLDTAIALIALREMQRVLEWPRITTNPWGPAVMETSLNVLRTMAGRMGVQLSA